MPLTGFRDLGMREQLVASAARTASGNSGALSGFSAMQQMVVQLSVTAASGTTPTLDVLVEDTVDGTNFNTIQAFSQATGVGRSVVRINVPFTNTIRVSWTVGGTTPSFTFAVDCYAEATASAH